MKTLMSAAKTLKTHCKGHLCSDCELFRRATGCAIGHGFPSIWEIDDIKTRKNSKKLERKSKTNG